MYRPRRLIRRKVHQVDSDCRGQLGVVISLYQLLGVGLGPVVQSPLEEAAMGKILYFDVEPTAAGIPGPHINYRELVSHRLGQVERRADDQFV